MARVLAGTVNLEHDDVDVTVVFVDMSGFSAYTEVHGDHRAAELASKFAAVAAMVVGPDDTVIKTIGDAAMVTSASASTALTFLRRLNDETRKIEGFPLVRAGMAAGSVVKHKGDVFGTIVNLAARLASVAEPGQIVANRAATTQLQCVGDVGPRSLGQLKLRNIDLPVEGFVLDIGTHHQHHVDPICRMHLEAASPELTLSSDGLSYRFCSTECLAEFLQRAEHS